MGLFGWLKRASGKAEDTLDQTKKDISETAGKIQQTLDESSKGVQTVVGIIAIALGVSIITNIVTIGLNIASHKSGRHAIIIEKLYLGYPRNE